MENNNFVPKDAQRVLSSHKISKKYDEQEVLYKETVHKNFSIFTGKHQCWSLLFEKRLQHRCFLGNTPKFLRRAILNNVCERLLLRVFPFMLV